jgi:Rieske Fe-S protein
MLGEDQERFEDYLELEHYLEELQAGNNVQLPGPLTPEKARIYRMAALLRSASEEAGQPRPEFAAELQARLEQEVEQQDLSQVPPSIQQKPASKTQIAARPTRSRPNVSRRKLLTGSAAVAASLAVGAGIGATIEQKQEGPTAKPAQTVAATNHGTPTPKWSDNLVASGTGHWVAIAPLAKLGESAIRFSSETLVGYVVRAEENEGVNEPVIAFSAACTHMGCIVKWQDTDRKFHCPCHGGLFTEYGDIDNSASKIHYLNALPRLRTKIENGTIFVEVPNPLTNKA